MTDFEFIFGKCKTAYYNSWNTNDIEECKERLRNLSHSELFALRTCRWMSRLNPLYTDLLELLFKDKFESITNELEATSTDELISIQKTTGSDFRKQKIAEILFNRYDTMPDDEKEKVYKMLVHKKFIAI